MLVQSNLSSTAPLGTEESGRCGEVAVLGREGCYMANFFQGVQHVYGAKFVLTVSHNVNPIINNVQRDQYTKILECFESKR